VFRALKAGIKDGLVTPKDAVNHWRTGGELPHTKIMRRATDPNLVSPPLDKKNIRMSMEIVSSCTIIQMKRMKSYVHTMWIDQVQIDAQCLADHHYLEPYKIIALTI